MNYKSTVLGLETAKEPPNFSAWFPILKLLEVDNAHLQSMCHTSSKQCLMALPTKPGLETSDESFKKRKNQKQTKWSKNVCNEIFIYGELNGLNFQLRLSLAKCWGVADGRLMKAE